MHVIKQSASQPDTATSKTSDVKTGTDTTSTPTTTPTTSTNPTTPTTPTTPVDSTDSSGKKNVVTVTQEKQKDTNPQPVTGPLAFTRIDIGSRVDLNGTIINPSTQLKSNNENIYVNLFVHNGIIGTKIELLMEHIETHSNIPSIATTLESEGNVQISYVFSAEKSGWPPGHYQLIATTSTGIKQTFTFTME